MKIVLHLYNSVMKDPDIFQYHVICPIKIKTNTY